MKREGIVPATSHGHRTWFFPDGDLPPAGDAEPKGHESLILLNPNTQDADVQLTVYFTDRQPWHLNVGRVVGERVRCIRLDEPIGDHTIPTGQYALKVEANQPLICQIGRMDVRQANLAYYTTLGWPSIGGA